MSSFGLPGWVRLAGRPERTALLDLAGRVVERRLGVEAKALHVLGHRSAPERLGHLRPDRVDRIGQGGRQRDRAPTLVAVVGEWDARDRDRGVAVDDRVGGVLAAVDRRGRGHDLERRTRRVLALGRTVQFTPRSGARVRIVAVVARVGVHDLHRARLRIERDDRAGAAVERLLGDPLRLGVERRVDVIADRVRAQLAEDRAQSRLEPAQRELAGFLEPGYLPLERVQIPDRLPEQRAGRIRPLPRMRGGGDRLRQHGPIVGDYFSSLDPQVIDQRPAIERVRGQRRRVEHRPPRRPSDQQREQHHHDDEQLRDRAVHAAGLRARSDTSNSSASRTKLAMIDDPP